MAGKEVEKVSTGGALALSTDQSAWTPGQEAALRQIGLEQATKEDLDVFLHVAQRSGLDPFARQIYMIGRIQNVKDDKTGRWDKKTKYTIQTGIDGFRLIADRTGKYEGQTEPEWCGEDGVWKTVWLSNKPPAAARVGVWKAGHRAPDYGIAVFSEYAQFKQDGSLTAMWSSKPSIMISKCAEALAFRKAFPQDLSGLYTAEEMSQADQPVVESAAPAPAQRRRPAAARPETVVEAAVVPVTLPDDFDLMVQNAENKLDLDDLGNLGVLAKESQNMIAQATVTAAWKRVVAERRDRGLKPGENPAPADEPIDAEIVDEGSEQVTA